jgi:dipeptide/tripeptide permease
MIPKQFRQALVHAGALLAAAAALRLAENRHHISADFAARAVQVAIGLSLAAYANLMPKQRPYPAAPSGRRQAALRAGAWSLTLAGLAYAALALLAPMPTASTAALAAVGTAVAITLIYAVWACVADRRDANQTTAL